MFYKIQYFTKFNVLQITPFYKIYKKTMLIEHINMEEDP